MELVETPNSSEHGIAFLLPEKTIALDPEEFQYSPPVAYSTLLRVYATWIHETAHHDYLALYDPWCMANPTACATFKDCVALASGGTYEGDPCSERYAYQKEGAALGAECMSVCNDTSLTQEEKDDKAADIDKMLKEIYNEWDTAAGYCEFCGGNIPKPADFGGAPPSGCSCPPA